MTVPLDEIDWERVRRLTFVPLLHDGRCALIPAGHGLVLPSGEVLEGEDPMLDTGLRVPRVTAGFRRQGLPACAAGSWTRTPSTATASACWRRPTSGWTASPARPRFPAGLRRPRHGSGATPSLRPDGPPEGRATPSGGPGAGA